MGVRMRGARGVCGGVELEAKTEVSVDAGFVVGGDELCVAEAFGEAFVVELELADAGAETHELFVALVVGKLTLALMLLLLLLLLLLLMLLLLLLLLLLIVVARRGIRRLNRRVQCECGGGSRGEGGGGVGRSGRNNRVRCRRTHYGLEGGEERGGHGARVVDLVGEVGGGAEGE